MECGWERRGQVSPTLTPVHVGQPQLPIAVQSQPDAYKKIGTGYASVADPALTFKLTNKNKNFVKKKSLQIWNHINQIVLTRNAPISGSFFNSVIVSICYRNF